jgi:hypothetical protein
MSRGPGRIERAIAAILDAEPDNAFTVEDLCRRIYGIERVEKRHRVAVLRAAATLGKRRDTLDSMPSDAAGGTRIYFNIDNVMSYAMARLKGDFLNCYGSAWVDPRYKATETSLRAKLAKGGDSHHLVVRGGSWWQRTHGHIAELEAKRSGNARLLAKVRRENAAKSEARMAEVTKTVHAMVR